MSVEIRRDDRGRIDEIVAQNASVHLERMDKDCWFLIVEGSNGIAEAVWLRRDNRRVDISLHEQRNRRTT